MTAKAKTEVAPKQEEKPFNIADFFTVPAASEGRQYPVPNPDGSKSGHFFTVLGADSPVAKQALLDATRIIRDETNEDSTEEEKVAVNERATLQFRATLVTDWTFPVKFSRKALTELLANNPGMAQDVERFSGDRTRFFASVLAA